MVSLLFRHHLALCHLYTASDGKLGGAWWGLGPRLADDKKSAVA